MKYKVGELVRSESYVIYEITKVENKYSCKKIYGSLDIDNKTSFDENELYEIPDKKKKEILDYIDRDRQIKVRRKLLEG